MHAFLLQLMRKHFFLTRGENSVIKERIKNYINLPWHGIDSLINCKYDYGF